MNNNNRNQVFNNNVVINCIDEAQDDSDPDPETPAGLVVSNLEDENDGDFSQGDLSLREAIALSNENEGSDTIRFDDSLSGGTIALDNSQGIELLIDDSLTINGLGQDNLTLDGSFFLQIIEPDIDVAIDGLNIIGGKIDNSGDLTFSNSTIAESFSIGSEGSSIISRGTLNIIDSTIKDNDGAQNTGILVESGTASIDGSTISNNTAIDVGLSGVIVRSDATVDISNSTIANNNSRSGAGVINSGGIVSIANSTIANNTGGLSNGGITNFRSEGTVTVTSSILANNSGGMGLGDLAGDGEYISGGNNLISNGDDAAGFVNGVNGDLVGSNGDDPLNPQTELLIDPQLGELQDNGGSTLTLALANDSPAIDAGSNPNNLVTDQRGGGFNRTVGNGTDIGAYEVQDHGGGEMSTEQLIVSTLEDENDGDFSAGDLSLREAIALANEQEGADTITFDGGLNGSIVLAEGELTVTDSVTIDGNNGQGLIIDGNNSSRVFKIDDGNSETNADVTLDGLVISNGNVAGRDTDNTGGGIFNQENLTIVRSTISNNRAQLGGGIANQGNLTLRSSYVDNNYAFEAGGIYTIAGTNRIIDSSINNNESNFVYGGIRAADTTINIDNSIIDGNSTGSTGGGISISNSTVSINNSTISNNSAGGNAGGISMSSNSLATINNSTITGNSAASNGGIVASGQGDKSINNSTITGNSATVGKGGGVKNYVQSTLSINNSTITGNFAAQGAAGVYQQKSFIAPDDLPEDVIISGTLNLNSSIVAGNENNQDLGGDSFNSAGNNLIGNGDGFESFFDSSQGDLLGTADNPIDPRLGDLQDNGGITQTIALLVDSPAIDAGNNANNLATDQRGEGFNRTVGNGTEIGAFELQTVSSVNEITGTPGSDFLQGSPEDDRISGLDGNDFIDAGNGNDEVNGNSGNDFINGGNDNDVIRGGDGHDRISGGNGSDTIDDGAGNDVVFGGSGSDRFVNSSSGNDLLTGGAGSDIFIFNLNPGAGFFDRDTILDFQSGTDVIGFRPVVDEPESFDNFDDLDTDGSGILDELDERVMILGNSTSIDFSDLFGRSLGSDTIMVVGTTNLNSDDFLFATTV